VTALDIAFDLDLHIYIPAGDFDLLDESLF
jgi:hypothetical protein